MKNLFIVGLCAITVSCLAQKSELKAFCSQLDQSLKNKAYKVQYSLGVKAKESDSKSESVMIQLYRNDERQKMVIGDFQEVIQEQELTLVVNHLMKEITLQKEKTVNPDQFLLTGLSALVDSAHSVEVTGQNGLKTFTLLYPETFIYTKLQLTISQKVNEIKQLYAEFSPKYPEGYHSVLVKYERWDRNWKPEDGFPNINRYLIKSGKKFVLQPNWNHYKFYQPESGTLKL